MLHAAESVRRHRSHARIHILEQLRQPLSRRGTTDGAYLRAKGMAVYGVPIFRKDGELRLHGNDERMSLDNLRSGTDLLRKIVVEVAKP